MPGTFKLTLAYDGAAYSGWQFQPDRPTLQGTLESALKQITRETIRVAGSGRTDAGVHALGQVVSFHSATRLPPATLQKALNATLPDDIAVIELSEAPPDFHAIRDCVRKRYRYVLHDGPSRDVFSRRYAWHVWHPLDEAAMQRAAQSLVGTQDFASFQTHGTERETTVRTVYEITVCRGSGAIAGTIADCGLRIADCRGEAEAIVTVEVEADGFLYNMVRTIVGTLVQVGRSQQAETWPAQVLDARDRRLAGMTAPPHGLFLLEAFYL